jgi:predicted TIM-barrel fold metal-dependent hydrolase
MENTIHLPQLSHSPIDIHSHIRHGSPYESPDSEISYSTLEFLTGHYRYGGVQQVGFSTFASVLGNLDCIPEENRYLHEIAKENPLVYQWVVIDPRVEESFRQAEAMLGHTKVLGIKIHPDYHGYDIMEHGERLFAFAEKHRAVMLMHPQHILEMPAFADRHPGMKLIIAHLGSVEHVDAVANAKHGNIFVDTSGSASCRNNIVEYAVERVGSEKILFGTDTYAFSFQFGRIALSRLPLADKENTLWKNALGLFPQLSE